MPLSRLDSISKDTLDIIYDILEKYTDNKACEADNVIEKLREILYKGYVCDQTRYE